LQEQKADAHHAPGEAERDPVSVTEDLARSLHLSDGERRIELAFHEGKLRRADLHLGPLKPDELRSVVQRLGSDAGAKG
jgi:hypothetical protein